MKKNSSFNNEIFVDYIDSITISDKFKRFLWNLTWKIFIKPLPKNMGRTWILFLYRTFGAELHVTANIYSSARVYAPWNLEMHANSCIAPEVDCYNVSKITIGAYSTISQKSYLCSASHDISSRKFTLITKPINIKSHSWIGAGSYIGMGVTIGEGAIIGATASVYKDVEDWSVVGGNPSKFIKKRVIND